jgi:hypothetical protein
VVTLIIFLRRRLRAPFAVLATDRGGTVDDPKMKITTITPSRALLLAR